MHTPSRQLASLMERAADMRVQGNSWVKIGEKLNRSPETVREWPRRYPDEWQHYYRQAEARLSMVTGSESTMIERSLLSSDDERIRLTASRALDRKRDKEIDRASRAAHSHTNPLWQRAVERHAFFMSLTDEEFNHLMAKHADESRTRVAEPGGPPPPGPTPPE